MNRPKEYWKRVEPVRKEVWAALKLGPWMLTLLLVVCVLWRPDLSASAGLFQSGAPTPEPPTAAPSLTPTTAPSATAAATGTPAVSPTAAPTTPAVNLTATVPVATTPVATPSSTPTSSPTSLPSATLPATATSTDTPTPTWTPVTPTATPFPSPTLPPEDGQDGDRYAEGESAYRFEWGMLVDSLALAASYLWLCCGVILLLGIPLLFIVLWVASRRRNQSQE